MKTQANPLLSLQSRLRRSNRQAGVNIFIIDKHGVWNLGQIRIAQNGRTFTHIGELLGWLFKRERSIKAPQLERKGLN